MNIYTDLPNGLYRGTFLELIHTRLYGFPVTVFDIVGHGRFRIMAAQLDIKLEPTVGQTFQLVMGPVRTIITRGAGLPLSLRRVKCLEVPA